MYESLLQQLTPKQQADFPYIFGSLNVSFIVLMVPVAVWFIKFLYFQFVKKSKKPVTNKMLLLTSVCFVLSVSCLRFCTYLFDCTVEENMFELIVNSIIQGVRGIALDENYIDVLDIGTKMIKTYFPDNATALTAFSILYNMTNILLPVFGGAFLINAILKFLPKFKLGFSFFKRQYYFSELNDRSLALATSITKQKIGWWKRPLLIFTDTYVDEDSEKSNEMYQAAKRIGAICLNDDIVHFHVPSLREKWFFLMDENEIDNILALAAFAEEAKMAHIKKAKVYVFYQNDAYALTEKRILDSLDNAIHDKYRKRIDRMIKKRITEWEQLNKARIEKKWQEKYQSKEPNFDNWFKKEKEKEQEKITLEEIARYSPVITRIRDFENQIFLLLRDIPLFTPLLLYVNRSNTTIKKTDKNTDPSNQSTVSTAENKTEQVIQQETDESANGTDEANIQLDAELDEDQKVSAQEDRPVDLAEISQPHKTDEATPQADYAQFIPQLNVTILGGGRIGMQMLLSSSWCGQIYGHSLGLNLVSIEEPEDIKKHLDQIGPEFLKSTVEPDMLRIYDGENEFNQPYFTFRYAQADLSMQDYAEIQCKVIDSKGIQEGNEHCLLESDYYLVALGSDELNITTAELLARKIALYNKKMNIDKDVVIVMMIYDSKISNLFRQSPDLSEYKNEHIHLRAFGSLELNYSIDNITLLSDNPRALAKHRNYSEITDRTKPNQRIRQGSVYNAWSSLANAFHYRYRIYSAYRFIKEKYGLAAFDECELPENKSTDDFSQLIMPFENVYINAISRKKAGVGEEESKTPISQELLEWMRSLYPVQYISAHLKKKDIEESKKKDPVTPDLFNEPPLAAYLAWLEHRRWVAYIRSCGFIHTGDAAADKNIVLKMHNCLVESKHEPFCLEYYKMNAEAETDAGTKTASQQQPEQTAAGESLDCDSCIHRIGCTRGKDLKDKLDDTGEKHDNVYKNNDYPSDVHTNELIRKSLFDIIQKAYRERKRKK